MKLKSIIGIILAVFCFVIATGEIPLRAEIFRMAVGDCTGTAQEALANEFMTLFEKKTNGNHTTKVFLNGQLGSEQSTVNDVTMGILDLSIVSTSNLAPFSPTLGILNMPYIFQSLDEANTTIQSPLTQELVENTIRDVGVRILAWTYSGFRTLSNSKKPVTKLADLDGLVIRVPKNEMVIKTYQSWGNNPTPIAWGESFQVYTALQQKVVDAQDTPYTTFYAMKFGELQRYLTEFHYNFLLEPLIISEAVFQSQDNETKQAILEAGKAASAYSLQWLKEKESGIKQELVQKYGLQINVLDDEKEWIKCAQASVWPKFYKRVGGKEKINELLRYLGRDIITSMGSKRMKVYAGVY